MAIINLSYTIQQASETDLITAWRLRIGSSIGTIVGSIGSADTSIVLNQSITLVQGTCVTIDSEVLQITQTTTGTTFTCSRNIYGTGAVAHSSLSPVILLIYPDPFTYLVSDYILNAHKVISNGLGTKSVLNGISQVTGSFA